MLRLNAYATPDLPLDIGSLSVDGDSATIEPPPNSLYEQLCARLLAVPPSAPRPKTLSVSQIGIATTALCLRWGTYLAFLWDPNKPLHPHAHDPQASQISDGEMARISIEFSANMSALMTLQKDDPAEFHRLMWAAYSSLPMPWPQVKPIHDTAHGFRRLASVPAGPVREAGAFNILPEHFEQHLMRAYANVVVGRIWRSGSPVETLHAGQSQIYSLTHRRTPPNQQNATLRYVCERIGPVLAGRQPWDSSSASAATAFCDHVTVLYAAVMPFVGRWTLTEETRTISLPLPEEPIHRMPTIADAVAG